MKLKNKKIVMSENAQAIWQDKPAFRNGSLVWGRVVKDIPDYYRELLRAFEEK